MKGAADSVGTNGFFGPEAEEAEEPLERSGALKAEGALAGPFLGELLAEREVPPVAGGWSWAVRRGSRGES